MPGPDGLDLPLFAGGPAGCVAGPGGWWLAPEGAVIHLESHTAVIADVHLGYEWARGMRGDALPAHSLVETLEKLGRLFGRFPVRRLVVAGDLVESAAPCERVRCDLNQLEAWLGERCIEFVPVAGNHDPAPLPSSIDLAGWTIAHGHLPLDAPHAIMGHHHPMLRVGGHAAPCFLVGPERIILPAFSPNAAGIDVRALVRGQAISGKGLCCWVAVEDALLDFGPVSTLSARLRGMRKESPVSHTSRGRA